MSERMLDQTSLSDTLVDLLDASHWIVGFSGGVDSTALLHLLSDWHRLNAGAPPLTALHINHAMQPAADAWQRHCERLCQQWGVPLAVHTVAVPPDASPEAAARAVRYAVFEQQLPPAGVLFLGHHLDDQVETFFLRLLRGAGVEGLAAIPPRRALGRGMLVRPLLAIDRGQIEHYAQRHALRYLEDPSNADTALDRNFLRAQLLPVLAERWPAYRQTVARASDHMATTAAVLRDSLGVPRTVRSRMGDPGMQLSEILSEGDAAPLKMRLWLQTLGYQAPDRAALEEFLRQIYSAAADARPRLSNNSYSLERFLDGIYALPDFPSVAPHEPLVLARGASIAVPGVGEISLQQMRGEGLQLAASEPLQIAWRQGGERCQLPGRAGSTSLKKLLQEWHVPPWWRDRVPLLYQRDELLAIGDLALCASSRWRPATSGELWWQLQWDRPDHCARD